MGHRIVNLEELDVSWDEVDTVDHLIGIFMSCRNIRKFTLRKYSMDDVDLTRTFRTILPIFTQLEKLVIVEYNYDDNQDLSEVFDVISSSCPNLRILGVRDVYLKDAANYFQNSNVIIFKC
jgi:hypothetical protein